VKKQIYLMSYESDTISVLSTETNAISKMSARGMHLWGIAQTDKTLYVTHIQDSSIAAIDLETQAITTIPTGRMPCALAVDAQAGKFSVANYADGSVTAIDNKSGMAIGLVNVGHHPQAMAIDSETPDLRSEYSGRYGKHSGRAIHACAEDAESGEESVRHCCRSGKPQGLCGESRRTPVHLASSRLEGRITRGQQDESTPPASSPINLRLLPLLFRCKDDTGAASIGIEPPCDVALAIKLIAART
jgi:YVTN family beta-propeller protein